VRVSVAVSDDDAHGRDTASFLEWLLADSTRWRLLQASADKEGDGLFVTCAFASRETFRTATRSAVFRDVAARVQTQEGMHEDLVTAACWLLSSTAIAASPLSTIVRVHVSSRQPRQS
jgi:hypothetical protein